MNAYIWLQSFVLNFDCFCKILMAGVWTHLSLYVMSAYSLENKYNFKTKSKFLSANLKKWPVIFYPSMQYEYFPNILHVLPPFGSLFLRSTGHLGILASFPQRDCAVSLLLAFKRWPSSQGRIPRDQVARGSCAAPLGAHLPAKARCPSLPGWQVLLGTGAIQHQVSCLIGTLTKWDGTLPIFWNGGPQFPHDCCWWCFGAEEVH